MDNSFTSLVIDTLAVATIVGQFLLFALIGILLVRKIQPKNKTISKIYGLVAENNLSFAFLISVVATCGSLFLSEVAGFNPCKLCWYQRIFMYPQVILLGIAAFINDNKIIKYSLPLVIIGFLIATYHYALQMSPLPLPCTDAVASCAAKQAARFGFVTIPLMAWTAFALIGTLLVFKKK